MAVTVDEILTGSGARLDKFAGVGTDELRRTAELALLAVERYLGDDHEAPDLVVREASIRVQGYLLESPVAPIRQDSAEGTSWTASRRDPIVDSGAGGVLQPYRSLTVGIVRRA